MRKVMFYFFKESGKFYDKEPFFFPDNKTVLDIINYAETECCLYKGMHIVIMFDENDSIGFPCMIISSNRVAY